MQHSLAGPQGVIFEQPQVRVVRRCIADDHDAVLSVILVGVQHIHVRYHRTVWHKDGGLATAVIVVIADHTVFHDVERVVRERDADSANFMHRL